MVGSSLLVRMGDTEEQLRAKDIAAATLGDNYVVALNLAATTPQWLRDIGASPMNLGLDLRGGVHFLLQVDMDSVVKSRMEAWEGTAKLTLRDAGVRYRSVSVDDTTLTATFAIRWRPMRPVRRCVRRWTSWPCSRPVIARKLS